MYQICMSNLVFGPSYVNIFLNFHLKSLIENLSDQNLFSHSYYLIFTDEESISLIEKHPNFDQLKSIFKVHFIKIEKDALSYQARYQLQTYQSQVTAQFALTNNLLLHMAAADLYYGENYFVNTLARLDQGFDAVVHVPMRVAYESAAQYLSDRKLSVDELFEVAFNNLHPLWLASNWNSPYFSKIPYHMIWSDERTICLRGFSLSPVTVVPKDWMLGAGGCTDITYLPNLQNPYYCLDWSEVPMLELGHIMSFYPPFSTLPSNAKRVADWARTATVPSNFDNLNKAVIFKKTTEEVNDDLIIQSQIIANEILSNLL